MAMRCVGNYAVVCRLITNLKFKIHGKYDARLETASYIPPKRAMESRKSPDNEMGQNESFYIENTSTGRFRRCLPDSDRDSRRNSWSSSDHQNSGECEADGELHLLHVVTKAALICFLFLQGILSGLSLSALYEALSPSEPEEFFAQYSAGRANEIRRYFFIGITLCATGSLCNINTNVATLVLVGMAGSSCPNSTTKSSTSACYLILTYFLALVITIVCSYEDLRLLDIASHMTKQGHYSSANEFRLVLQRWRGLSVSRSVFCLVGWLISCYQFFSRKNTQRTDNLSSQ